MTNDFKNYATKHLGMNGLALDKYIEISLPGSAESR